MLQRPDLHGWDGLKWSDRKLFLALGNKGSVELRVYFKPRESKRHIVKPFGQLSLAYHGPFLLALLADMDGVTAIVVGCR